MNATTAFDVENHFFTEVIEEVAKFGMGEVRRQEKGASKIATLFMYLEQWIKSNLSPTLCFAKKGNLEKVE